MPQIINTNIASLNAQRNLNSAQAGNDTALQRLSSGLRINSAADDAAGLSISTRFDSQINGNNQAIRNSADGVSLAQTAEGALDSITDSLQRIRELAVQSANGTNNAIDREALNLEAQQLIDEIENVSQTANFNGTSLLDGSFTGITFQTGANVGNSIEVSIGEVTTSTLGVAETAGVSAMGGEITADVLTGAASVNYVDNQANALANGDLVINGVSIDASKSAADTSSTAFSASSAIAKAAAINEKSDETGVTAVALETVVQGQALSAGGNTYADDSGTLEINGVSIAISTAANLDADTNREAIAAAINAVSGQTGVTAINTGDDDTGITLSAADGRNIAISSFTMATATQTAQLGLGTSLDTGVASAVESVVTGSILLQSADGSDITIEGGTGNIENTGFTEGTKSGSKAQLSSTRFADAASASPATIDAGDLTINGISIRATTTADDTSSYSETGASFEAYISSSAIARAAAINEVSEETGVTAVAEENVVKGTQGTTVGAAGAVFTINGVSTTAIDLSAAGGDASDRRSNTVDAINSISGQTGVVAVDAGDGIELRAADGRNITVESNQANGATNAFDATGLALPDTVAANAGVNGAGYTFTSTVRLESAGEFTLDSETGGIEDFGFRAGTYGAEEAGTFLKDVDLSTVDGALTAITAVDNALQQVSSERANLGATQNRFNSTISNLTITSENLSASNSRIRDADYAAETAELSRTQVLIQAGISVLSQANARPQQVLSLLG
ncbi:flagellin [Litoribrevibacter euphylliae]|uniref:Flagellin n=1 Tax=Litoribrevibacter euphylliae TaxID=1834034 RepID=A0ABV7H800_9GAMM